MIGKMVGRYQIVELLGRGGMAEVYKAYQQSLDRYVAIKLMHTFLSEDSDFFERFNREAKNVAALRHPNIIQIHDFDHEGKTYYMVMEFVDGGTLKDRLEQLARQGQRIPLNEAVGIIKDVGSALSYSHKRGMIHRDIKPANVMIDSNGRVILTDFGIAKMLSGAKFTASGSILGTPSYMAPEQGLGQPGDARADIYSLGVLLYQLSTGRLPYDADTPVAVILKHVNEQLPPPRTINPNTPQSVENIIVRALAKDPAHRYQTVEEMLADLNNIDSAAHLELPPDSTIANRPGERTMRTVPDAHVGATVVSSEHTKHMVAGGPASALSEPALKPTPAAGPNLTPFIIGGVALVVIAIIVGVVIVGGGLFAASQQPTATAVAAITHTSAPTDTAKPGGSPTIDPVIMAITEQAGTAAAQQATIAALQATDTPVPTPNLTATFEACTFDAKIVSQDPKDGSSLTINKETKVNIEIQNTGTCAWEDTTQLTFDSGDSIHTAASVPAPAAKSGDTVVVAVALKPAESRTYTAKWIVRLASGRDVGAPFTLTYKGIVAATAAPRPTLVPTPVPPTPTSAVIGGGPITGANPTFFSCSYVPNTTDYQCLTSIGVGGGTAPYTITIDGDSSTTKTGSTAQNPYFIQLRGRRCIDRIFTFQVIDATGQVFNGSGAFYPKESKLFNNNTEVCGDG